MRKATQGRARIAATRIEVEPWSLVRIAGVSVQFVAGTMVRMEVRRLGFEPPLSEATSYTKSEQSLQKQRV